LFETSKLLRRLSKLKLLSRIKKGGILRIL